jgi:hypothetical protein
MRLRLSAATAEASVDFRIVGRRRPNSQQAATTAAMAAAERAWVIGLNFYVAPSAA